MSETLDINGTQYCSDHYNSYSGYKCCTTVEHNINLYNNSNQTNTTVDIPQLDCNCHILMMHLYDSNTLVDLTNVSNISIKFICGDKTVIGDYRNLNTINAQRGMVSYLLTKDITSNIGNNQIELTITIGTGTITFKSNYNVVPTIQTTTETVVLPDVPQYGP